MRREFESPHERQINKAARFWAAFLLYASSGSLRLRLFLTGKAYTVESSNIFCTVYYTRYFINLSIIAEICALVASLPGLRVPSSMPVIIPQLMAKLKASTA